MNTLLVAGIENSYQNNKYNNHSNASAFVSYKSWFCFYQPIIRLVKKLNFLKVYGSFVCLYVSWLWFHIILSCSCVWICLVVSCIWFPCLCIMSCVLIFHAPLSFKCLLCSSLCLPLSVVLFPPCFLLCAPLPRYITWPPPSSLSSPVPRLIISVGVLSLCFPSCLCPFIASVCVYLCSCSCLCDVPS